MFLPEATIPATFSRIVAPFPGAISRMEWPSNRVSIGTRAASAAPVEPPSTVPSGAMITNIAGIWGSSPSRASGSNFPATLQPYTATPDRNEAETSGH